MARIFKQTYTKHLPKDAELFMREGKRYARFKNAAGRIFTGPLSKNGESVILETAKWYIDYADADGRPCRVAGFKDMQATKQRASELERTAEHVRSGYKPKEHEQLARPLSDHAAEFKAALLAKGDTAKQAQQVYNRAVRILNGCEFVVWSDISAAKVQAYLSQLRADKENKRGISSQTSNWYLQAIKAFCGWLVQEKRVPENPVAYLEGLNVKTDRRHDRRAMSEQESKNLLTVAAAGPVRQGMAGADRAMLYWTALESGLRAGELRTLTVGNCKLADQPPVLVVKAGYSKHRREDNQPIPVELAEAFTRYTAGRWPTDLLFPSIPPAEHVSKMIKADLEAAGIDYRDSAGLVVDFHGLRHSYITNLAKAGIHPKTAMDLARHSNINLTMGRYTHTILVDRASALSALPSLTNTPDCQQSRQPGTYAAGAAGIRAPGDKQDNKRSDGRMQALAATDSMANGKAFAKPLTGIKPRSRVRIPTSPFFSPR
jgi:integrase